MNIKSLEITVRKELGKIQSVTFGLGGYQDACLGIHITLGGESWGVSSTKSTWDSNMIKHSEYTHWTEQDRDKSFAEIMRYVSDLLAAAKVTSVDKLKGVPVEAEFDGNLLKSWRVLAEVL